VKYAMILAVLAVPALAEPLPSGIEADLVEVLVDTVGTEQWVRFRLVAPAIDRGQENAPDFTALEGDFPHLCTTLALPYLAEYALEADKIVISLADRAVEFGATDPDATQYFEQFRAEDGDCIWEGF